MKLHKSLPSDPVLVDIETRSACELRKAGGWNYASDPTTHITMVCWTAERDSYHIWYPWHDSVSDSYLDAARRAAGIDPEVRVCQHFGATVPDYLARLAASGRVFAAHNAWNFDSLVWREKLPECLQPVGDWLDTDPLARAVALPGALDAIGKRLWGEGKYAKAKATLKKTFTGREYGDAADIPVGLMPTLAAYNLQDVILLRGLWDELERTLRFPEEEWGTLAFHREVNERGVGIDREFLAALLRLTVDGVDYAVKRIAEITAPQGSAALRTINDLQSRNKVFAWLDAIGVSIGTSLRREVVTQFIEAYEKGETGEREDEVGTADPSADSGSPDDDEGAVGPGEARARQNLALAVDVLSLRLAALRVTGGKLTNASLSACADSRARGLFVFGGAHTGRWAGRRIQLQNLPRPKKGVDYWSWMGVFEFGGDEGRFDFATIREALELQAANAKPDMKAAYSRLTPDDVSSGMIRQMLREDEGVLMADLANIEARVLAWLAGEEWLVRAFWDGADPYIPMAESIFGPKETWPGVSAGLSPKKHDYRQVGKIVELGSGYQMSGAKTEVYAVANGIDLAAVGTSGQACNDAYRRSHPAIAGVEAGEYEGRPYFRDGFWHKLDDAARNAVLNPGAEYRVGVGAQVTFVREGAHLMCYLPSGRRLIYRNAKVVEAQPSYLRGTNKYVLQVQYQSPRALYPIDMYGGKWCENVVQAVSRDFMAYGAVRVNRRFPVILHVHDEAGARGKVADRHEFLALFTTCPPWAKNFPLDAEGGWTPRYSKSVPPNAPPEEVWRNGARLTKG